MHIKGTGDRQCGYINRIFSQKNSLVTRTNE